jgi:hypothetical protein
VKQPNVVTWTAKAQGQLLAHHPARKQAAATRHHATPVTEVRPPSDPEMPITRTPPNERSRRQLTLTESAFHATSLHALP